LAISLALVSWPASAAVYNVDGDFTVLAVNCSFPSKTPQCGNAFPPVTFAINVALGGTVEIDNGTLTDANLTSDGFTFQYPPPLFPRPQPPQLLFTSPDLWSLHIYAVCCDIDYPELTFTDNAGLLTNAHLDELIDDPFRPDRYLSGATGAIQCGIEEPNCLTTPLPPALPLFVGGLGLLFALRKKHPVKSV
jgi:hypothetical protein